MTGLVNNAGVTAHIADLADTPVAVVRQVVEVNLVGAIICARRAAQVLSTRRGGAGGAVVNVSSAAATLGSPHEYVHYAAAKAGVDALTVGLAKELAGDGIRVNAVAPGLVRTGIHAAAGAADRVDRVAARIPLRRAGEPHEIAPAIAWLLSEEASLRPPAPRCVSRAGCSESPGRLTISSGRQRRWVAKNASIRRQASAAASGCGPMLATRSSGRRTWGHLPVVDRCRVEAGGRGHQREPAAHAEARWSTPCRCSRAAPAAAAGRSRCRRTPARGRTTARGTSRPGTAWHHRR
ncbi:MAG: SDR family oxidoreductase [Nocardioidaceae bacterium]